MLTRADCTTRNQRKADRLRRTYDDLEARIARLSEEEELASIRPDLDGNQIMEILGIPPGREVGEAYRFLLELRLDHGPMSPDRGPRRPPAVGCKPPVLARRDATSCWHLTTEMPPRCHKMWHLGGGSAWVCASVRWVAGSTPRRG